MLRAGLNILELGPPIVIIKKGEHGALVISREGHFAVPGFPLETVTDPTGAGDTFAGAILGYLASVNDHTPQALRRAVAYGAVVASYTVQGDSFVNEKPRVWLEKLIANTGLVGNYGLAPDGKSIAALMPLDGPEQQASQSHVTFLQNFFDEVRRRTGGGGK